MNSPGDLPSGEATASIPALHLSGTVGLFDGFSLGPTVGGFGSLDLSVAGQWTRKPEKGGFQDGAAGWGVGGRIGLFRESFSLPGLSVTAFHRFLGDHSLWQVAGDDPVEAAFDLQASSLRAMVGKDLWGIGFFGGFGWDRYLGDVSLVVSDPSGGSVDSAGAGEVRSSRRVAFVGASRTFLTLQLSGEVGWGEGFEPNLPDSSVSGPHAFDPSSASYFGSLALRLTF
jgi:hypothetical protein